MSYQGQFYLPDQQWWEVAQERFRQTDALNRIGEFSLFLLRWSVRDFNAGLVGLCPTCNDGDNVIQSVYKQSAFDRCPTCYGCYYSGIHGGIKAQLVRPTAWVFDEIQTDWQRKGEVEKQSVNLTSTGDFRCQPKDWVFRGDGNRYQISSVQALHLTSGFGTVSHTNTAVSVNYQAALENPSSPAYTIPPLSGYLQDRLNPMYARFEPYFTDLEFVDGQIEF